VFTPGTSIRDGGRFLPESVAACGTLGCRGLLLTRFADQVPASLPRDVRHFDYLPFGRVLLRAAALVHFGGIGSSAQALAAGIPQLIVPTKNDQHENARRLEALGVAVVLQPRAYRAAAAVEALKYLLGEPAVASRCRMLAEKMRREQPLDETCRLLEELQETSRQRRAA
jgi:UDP:flavonoid glycosyltransferase YjiC (YdhE family)